MTSIEARNEKLAQTLINHLKRRHINGYYCPTAAQAVKQALQLIPTGSIVTWGGSVTVRDMGLTQALIDGDYRVVDRDLATSDDEKRRCYLAAMDCDYYLTSANAVTQDGLIVNVDGRGNRVAAITWGPRNVLFVIGMNKVVQTLDAAIARARGIAAPINTSRLGTDTPCNIDGVCHDCLSAQCICNHIHVLRNSFPSNRHTVLLVGENLGY